MADYRFLEQNWKKGMKLAEVASSRSLILSKQTYQSVISESSSIPIRYIIYGEQMLRGCFYKGVISNFPSFGA